MRGIYVLTHPDLRKDNVLFFNWHYSRNYKLLPRVRVIGYAGKRINIACFEETNGIWVLVRDEDIPSNDVMYEFDCTMVLGKNTKHARVLIWDGNNVIDDLFISHYPDWAYYGFSKPVTDVVPSEFNNTEGELLIVDVDKMQQYRLKYKFPSNVIPGFDREGRHIIVFVAYKKYTDGKWVKLDPPLLSVIYWDGSKATTILMPVQMNYAIATFTFEFQSFDELYKFLSTVTRGYPVASEIMLNNNLTVVEKCRLLAPLLTDIFNYTMGHRVLHAFVDSNKPILYITVKLWAGGVNWELVAGVISIIVGVVLIATGVGAGAGAWLTGIGMAKVGAIIGLGAILTAGGGYLLYRAGQKLQPGPPVPPTELVRNVESALTKVVEEVSADFSNLAKFVDELYKAGKISEEVRNMLIERISEISKSTTDKLEDLRKEIVAQVTKAYEDGWKAGYGTAMDELRKRNIVYYALAGLGGLASGVMISQMLRREK